MFLKFTNESTGEQVVVECVAYRTLKNSDEDSGYRLNGFDIIYTSEEATSEYNPFESNDFLPFETIGALPNGYSGAEIPRKFNSCYVMNSEGKTLEHIKSSCRKLRNE